MARKKSYERMMNIEDSIGNPNRIPVNYMSDIGKKNQDILLSVAKPVQLARI